MPFYQPAGARQSTDSAGQSLSRRNTDLSTEEDDKQIILNEQQEYYIETDTRTKKYIRLFLVIH